MAMGVMPPVSMQRAPPGERATIDGNVQMGLSFDGQMMTHVAMTVPQSIPMLAQPPQQPVPQSRSQGKRGHGSGAGGGSASSGAVIEKKPLVRRNQPSVGGPSSSTPLFPCHFHPIVVTLLLDVDTLAVNQRLGLVRLFSFECNLLRRNCLWLLTTRVCAGTLSTYV